MRNDTPKRRKQESVLVVTHGDNYIKVYAEEYVSVKIVDCPYTGDAQPLAEDCLELSLAHRWRKLYLPTTDLTTVGSLVYVSIIVLT